MEKKPDLKSMSFQARLQYIWEYYKLHIGAVLIGAVLIVSVIHQVATYREPVLTVIMVNCNDPYNADDSGFSEYLAAAGYDPEKDSVNLQASLQFSDSQLAVSYQDAEVLGAMIASGETDLLFGTGDLIPAYAEQGAFLDLSSVVPAETLAAYEGHLLYAADEATGASYPCAVELTGNSWLTRNNYYDTCYFGILNSAPHAEAVRTFTAFLLNE